MADSRYARQHLIGARHTAIVDFAGGLADDGESEVREAGEHLLTPGRRELRTKRLGGRILLHGADYRTAVELTMRLATAQDVRLVLKEGAAHNREQLRALIEAVRWEELLGDGGGCSVRADSRASTLYHEGLIRDVAAAAIAARGCCVVEDDDEHRVTVELAANRATIALSLAGRPLWQRGYRAELGASAPLREDLAHASIRAALPSLDPDTLFVPFCGSGTLLFEALIALLRIPPALFGRRYAFDAFAFEPPASVAWLRRAFAAKLDERIAARTAPPLRALLVDRDAQALRSARANWDRFRELLRSAGVSKELPIEVEFAERDALESDWRSLLGSDARRIFVPLNPPYGLRLHVVSVERSYRRIGARCRELALAPAPGQTPPRDSPPAVLSGFVLCPSERSWRAFLDGARELHSRTVHFGEGGLDVRRCVFCADAPRASPAR